MSLTNPEIQSGISIHRSVEEIQAFLDEIERVYMLDHPSREGTERRSVKRMNVTMPVEITPLGDASEPSQICHHAITRDISTMGVGLDFGVR